jgi:tetratricopeptide (TPR) repeat protein
MAAREGRHLFVGSYTGRMNSSAEITRAWQAFAAGDHAGAARAAQLVLDRSPDDPAALTLIGRLALVSGEAEVAVGMARRVLGAHPDTSAVWLDLARALRELGQHALASDAARQATMVAPADPAGWTVLGEILLSLNQRDSAAGAFRRAVDLDPDAIAALRGLCVAEVQPPESDVVRRMIRLAATPDLQPRERAGLHYSLAQVFRRSGDREPFIEHLFKAHRIQKTLARDGSRAHYQAHFDRLESAFTARAVAGTARAQVTLPAPIFILGMPRSGTTLMEQLLAAHPDVAAGGELDYVRGPVRRAIERWTDRPFPERFETVSGDQWTSVAAGFSRRLGLIGGEAARVTDKTPGNYHVLGLLPVLFPNCSIVHMSRDPMDTCFSILQYQFGSDSPHTCDIALLAYVYARYRRLMARWEDLCGDRFVTVGYEALVESPASEARRAFQACGLEWSDAYLAFHQGDVPARTFSTAQVRGPIYRSSVGAWREFADELEPLRQALEAELASGCGKASALTF